LIFRGEYSGRSRPWRSETRWPAPLCRGLLSAAACPCRCIRRSRDSLLRPGRECCGVPAAGSGLVTLGRILRRSPLSSGGYPTGARASAGRRIRRMRRTFHRRKGKTRDHALSLRELYTAVARVGCYATCLSSGNKARETGSSSAASVSWRFSPVWRSIWNICSDPVRSEA